MITLRLDRNRSKPYRLLCLGAHSDDIEIGCGGTVLKLLKEYPECSVQWVVFSADGERSDEARDSARVFLGGAGEQEIRIESFQNAYFPDQWAQIKRCFEDKLKPFGPDLVFTHYREDRHQDHRIISDLTWNTFRDHLILEYEIPKYDGDLGQPNFFIPLADEICETKINTILDVFETQASKHWFSADTFWSHLRLRGIEIGAPHAEGFHARKLKGIAK